jgi:hypothetical protein
VVEISLLMERVNRMKLKRLVLFVAIFVATTPRAWATVQQSDELRWGEQTYYILQSPMFGLWHIGPDNPPQGKMREPDFEWTTTANRKGYSPVWEIRDQKLFLQSITGRLAGKDLADQMILSGKKFPLQATWFSGKIFLPIGNYDANTRQYDAVIVFDIDQGNVKSMTFIPAARAMGSWNGL